MTDSHDKHTTQRQEYARLETRAFSIVLETIGIFGVPALLAVGISKWFSLSDTYTYVLLGIFFILSWVVLLRRIKHMTQKLEEMRKKMNEKR